MEFKYIILRKRPFCSLYEKPHFVISFFVRLDPGLSVVVY